MKLKTIHLEQTDSTNRWLREHMGEADADITVVTADYQTAGRGQGSNTWNRNRGRTCSSRCWYAPITCRCRGNICCR